MQALRFVPILMPKIWGGRRLKTLLAKPVPPDEAIGESWELSDHPSAPSRLAEGKGQTLRELIEKNAEDILGTDAPKEWRRQFPILIKFIDATDRLSIQVHPDDEFASKTGESGKTECWVVVHAEPDAWIIHGTKKGVTKDLLRRAVEEDKFNRVKVTEGDFIFVPAGTPHAIGPGLLLAEIQQTSDVTYRLWDWGRLGEGGTPRRLDVDLALDCIHYDSEPPGPSRPQPTETGPNWKVVRLCNCHAFGLSKVELEEGNWSSRLNGKFSIVIAIKGKGDLQTAEGTPMPFSAGDTVLVPASAKEFRLKTDEGLTALLVSPPNISR